MGNTTEIRERYKVAEEAMLRIHQEMLDIHNAFQGGYSPVIGPQQIVDWFNAIKEFWPFQEMSELLAENARLEAELKAAVWQDPECFEPDIGQHYLILYGDGGNSRVDKAEYFGEGFYATRLYGDGTAAHGVDGSHLLGVMPIPKWRGAQPATGAERSGAES